MKYINQLRMEFMSIPDNVGLARLTVAAFASQLDYTVSEIDDIKGAISEAVSNAIIHGYEGRPENTVRIVASLTTRGLEVIVEDTGKGIENVKEAMLSGYSSVPERLGLGFSFMQSFMDEVAVLSEPMKGTRVIMFKQLGRRGDYASEN
ncbi:anti-sigma F factor [Desulforudis sp. 1088]|uniref:anti-sigma F factor n=1 Tax=unclassified Candidatus Desulforudis TaxID=2635950 RepID=UPI0034977701